MKVTLSVSIEKDGKKDEVVSSSIEVGREIVSLEKDSRQTLLNAVIAKMLTAQANETQKILKESHQVLLDTQEDGLKAELEAFDKLAAQVKEVYQGVVSSQAAGQESLEKTESDVFDKLAKYLIEMYSHSQDMADHSLEMVLENSPMTNDRSSVVEDFKVIKNKKTTS